MIPKRLVSILPANNKATNGQANQAVTEHASRGQSVSKSSLVAIKEWKMASKDEKVLVPEIVLELENALEKKGGK